MQLHSANGPTISVFGFCVDVKLESVRLLLDLANDGENSLALVFVLQDLDIRYVCSLMVILPLCIFYGSSN